MGWEILLLSTLKFHFKPEVFKLWATDHLDQNDLLYFFKKLVDSHVTPWFYCHWILRAGLGNPGWSKPSRRFYRAEVFENNCCRPEAPKLQSRTSECLEDLLKHRLLTPPSGFWFWRLRRGPGFYILTSSHVMMEQMVGTTLWKPLCSAQETREILQAFPKTWEMQFKTWVFLLKTWKRIWWGSLSLLWFLFSLVFFSTNNSFSTEMLAIYVHPFRILQVIINSINSLHFAPLIFENFEELVQMMLDFSDACINLISATHGTLMLAYQQLPELKLQNREGIWAVYVRF